jgi:hypothetical protein
MWKKLAIIGLLLGMVVAIAYAQKAQVGAPGSGAQHTQADKRGTQESPLVVEEHSVQTDKEASDVAARDAEHNRTDSWLIWLTLAMAIAAFLQVCGIGGQILVYLKQTSQLERQVTASHDGLRAWLGVRIGGIEDKNFLTHVEKLTKYRITNYGQTPAFMKSISVANAAFDPSDESWKTRFHPLTVNGFLGAGISENNILWLSGDAVTQCEDGRKIWRIVVKIEYDDAFGNSHETMASFHYRPKSSTPDPLKRGFYQDVDPATNYNR